MREIKFRAWDKETKEMLFDGVEYELRCISMESEEAGYKHSGVMTPAPREYKRFELMQYTGLKDKNGKEIYEGDILTFKSNSWIATQLKGERLKKRIAIISWNDEEYCWWVGSLDDDKDGFKPTKDIDNNKFKIIGNIYEAPEIIKL